MLVAERLERRGGGSVLCSGASGEAAQEGGDGPTRLGGAWNACCARAARGQAGRAGRQRRARGLGVEAGERHGGSARRGGWGRPGACACVRGAGRGGELLCSVRGKERRKEGRRRRKKRKMRKMEKEKEKEEERESERAGDIRGGDRGAGRPRAL